MQRLEINSHWSVDIFRSDHLWEEELFWLWSCLLSNHFIKSFYQTFSISFVFTRICIRLLCDLALVHRLRFDQVRSIKFIESKMSKKQLEEEDRLFFKSLLKSFSRSFFRSLFQTRARTRSQTRSMIESESASSNSELASSASLSVIESDTTERNLARSIREQSVNDVLINQYVIRMFRTFFQNNIQDHELWKTIYYAFENFKLEHWNMLIISNWNVIKKICYTQRFWIDKSSRNVLRDKLMLQTAKDDYYENWTMNQIKYVERHYRSISSATQNRKNELLKICDQSSIQQSLSTQTSHSSSFSSSQISITLLNSSISISRQYDVQSNRQYEPSEYAFAEYAHENLRSMNQIRQTFQSDYQAFESYVSSS